VMALTLTVITVMVLAFMVGRAFVALLLTIFLEIKSVLLWLSR
jgi:hypothetical protein